MLRPSSVHCRLGYAGTVQKMELIFVKNEKLKKGDLYVLVDDYPKTSTDIRRISCFQRTPMKSTFAKRFSKAFIYLYS